MKAISFSLAVAFGLAVGLSACQDQTVVAPDDEVVSPDQLHIAAKKPAPVTKEVDFLLGFNQPDVDWEPAPWNVGSDDGRQLSLSAYNQSFEASLTNTAASVLSDEPEGGVYGPCIYDPVDTPARVIKALAEQLDGSRVDPWEPDPYLFPHNTLSIDRTALAAEETSEESRVQFGYSSDHPDLEVYAKIKKDYVSVPGTVSLRVGGVLRLGDFGNPTVTRKLVGEAEHFTFFGGTVSVTHWDGNGKPRLECELLDEVEVSVRGN